MLLHPAPHQLALAQTWTPPAVVLTPCTTPYTNEIGDGLRQQLETTPRIMNVVDVPLHSRRQIIRESREEQRAMTTQNDAAAVFSTNISLNQHNKARRIRYAEFQRHPGTNHTGNLESYHFDRDMASRTFMENADPDGCLDSLAGRWAALAWDCGLKRQVLPEDEMATCTAINTTQVSPYV